MNPHLTIKNTAAWANDELINGIARQGNTLLNCRLAIEALTSTPLCSAGRDPRLNILALAADSLLRTKKLQAEACTRDLAGNLKEMRLEGFILGDDDGFFKGWAQKLAQKGGE